MKREVLTLIMLVIEQPNMAPPRTEMSIPLHITPHTGRVRIRIQSETLYKIFLLSQSCFLMPFEFAAQGFLCSISSVRNPHSDTTPNQVVFDKVEYLVEIELDRGVELERWYNKFARMWGIFPATCMANASGQV